MKLMRGDMGEFDFSSCRVRPRFVDGRYLGGAATVVSSTLAIAQLQLPVNVIALTPLCENLPGPSATKPGDM